MASNLSHEIESETENLFQVSIQQNPEDVSILPDVTGKSPRHNSDGAKINRKTKSWPECHINLSPSPFQSPLQSPFQSPLQSPLHSLSQSANSFSSLSSPSSNEAPYVSALSMMAQINEAVLAGGNGHKLETLQLRDEQYLKYLEVAETAVRFGLQGDLQLVLNQFPFLFFRTNARGDTLLHLAARAGQLNIVKYLLDPNLRDIEMGDEQAEKQRTLKNRKGNTALHEALENKQEEVARLLVAGHAELLYLPNDAGETSAYLAAEAGLLQLLEDMLGFLLDSQDLSKWEGKKTPLHAAVIRKHKETLKLVLELKPQLIHVTDSEGRNPLHYAACIGYSDGLTELLKKDIQPAYQSDNIGAYPIHMAAFNGHIKVIQHFLKKSPRTWSLLSRGGQNILHMAALSDKENVVRHILKAPEMAILINEVDAYGNTPLHLATEDRNFKVVRALTRDRSVNMNIINNSNLTALDIAEKNMVNVASFPRMLTLTALRIANARRAGKPDIVNGKRIANARRAGKPDIVNGKRQIDNDGKRQIDNDGKQPTNVDYYKDRVNTLLLVSTLVATVTFTAGFTIPGGLNSNGGPDQGIPTMLTHTMFKIFALSNTIALFCSILAVISLIWAQVGDLFLVRSIISFAWALLGISLSMMTLAFAAGLYLVTSPLRWLATAILIMTIIFLICDLALLLPLLMPIWSKYCFFQNICYCFIYLLVALTRIGSDVDNDGDIKEGGNFIAARLMEENK